MSQATLLQGVSVVELGDFFSAAYCAKILADLGADVIKIEPRDGDSARRHGPFPDDVPHHERSGLFAYLNTNKRSLTLDLAHPSARSVVIDLLSEADVLVENLGQDYLSTLGLDQQLLHQSVPDLVVTSLSAFGHKCGEARPKGDDLIAFHASGYAQIVGGLVDDPSVSAPVKAAEYQADLLAAINGVTATLVSLWSNEDPGRPLWNDVSARDSLVPFIFTEIARYLETGTIPSRRRDQNPPNSVVVILPTLDGEVAISPREEHLWQRWVGVMGNPEWASDPRFENRDGRANHWAEIYQHLATWSKQRTKDEVARLAQEARVPSFPVNDISASFASEQLAWRGFFQEVDHPELGCVNIPTAPYSLSGHTCGAETDAPAPLLGEHTASILEGLGYSRDRILALYRAEVI